MIPYFNLINQTEGYTYDPYGEYVRQWLPELARLPTEWIHHPWDAPPSVLRAAGVELGSNYPRPIVEVVSARERLREAMAQMWEQEEALKVAGLQGDDDALKVNNVMTMVQPFITTQRPQKVVETVVLRPSSGPSPSVEAGASSSSLSASPHWDEMVPTFGKQFKMHCNTSPSLRGSLNSTTPLKIEAASQEENRTPSMASTTKDAHRKNQELPDSRGKLLAKNQTTWLGYTPPPSVMSDEMSTAESSSSPKKVRESRQETHSMWVPTILHRMPSSSFGRVPSDDAPKHKNTDFLAENQRPDDKVRHKLLFVKIQINALSILVLFSFIKTTCMYVESLLEYI